MRNYLALITLAILFVSCNQKYKYIETVQEAGPLASTIPTDEEPEIIKAKTDSAAYIEAFRKFCISKKIAQDMDEAYDFPTDIPLSFKLLNEKGENIAITITFQKKDSIENKIKKRIFSQPNEIAKTIKEIEQEEHQKALSSLKIDTATVERLTPYFRIKTDEFDPNQSKWYIPKSAPRYINQNGIYCYFEVKDQVPRNFRIKIQYHSDEWLFIEKYQFSIDGKAYEFYPRNVERDNGNGGHIWEWSDDRISVSDLKLIKAIANAKDARIKYVGDQYYKIRRLSNVQIKSIKRALNLYLAMGGKF